MGYAVRGKVVKRSTCMTRFFRTSADAQSSRLSFSLDPIETRVFDDYADDIKYDLATSLENSPDLSLNALLDYLDVENWVKVTILAMEQGDSCTQLTDIQMGIINT